MNYNIKKLSVSNYPNPIIYCTVQCFLKEEDMQDETKAVYWIPFSHDLSCCVGKTEEEINSMVKEEGERLFLEKESQGIFEAIEIGASIVAPEIL